LQAEGEESGVLNLSAAPNSLNLVLRDEGLMKFVKWVAESEGDRSCALMTESEGWEH
jgi:hypothetical protein